MMYKAKVAVCSACNTDTTQTSPTAPNLQHTANQEQNDQCGNTTA